VRARYKRCKGIQRGDAHHPATVRMTGGGVED
jgi:hypothetical protein